jgi:hypothetical protein
MYHDGRFSMDRVDAPLILDLALIGALVSLSLPVAAELVSLSAFNS